MVQPPDDIERFRQDGLKSLANDTTLGEKHREATPYGETILESHGHIKLLLDYSSLNVLSFTFRSQRILERFGRGYFIHKKVTFTLWLARQILCRKNLVE